MRALLVMTLFVPVALTAQQPPPQSGGLGELFREQQGPAVSYKGYAFLECSPSNTPTVRIVAIQGLVPDGIPKASPRPSIELALNAGVDAVAGKKFTIAPKASDASSAVAMSCPVFGNCGPAESGTLTIGARGENGDLTGEFVAKWPIGAPRAGKFVVSWRDSQAKC